MASPPVLDDLVAPLQSAPAAWVRETARWNLEDELAPVEPVTSASARDDVTPSTAGPLDGGGAPGEPEDEGRGAGWCAQCGALLSASDIFCGECGFVRQAVVRPRDTEILDPFPWGLATSSAASPDRGDAPGPAVVPAANAATTTPDEADEADDAFDDTRIVAPGARGDRFILQFSTGESVTVTGSGLLGRNPVAEPGEYVDAIVAISDPGRSVSKTHLEFGQEGGSFWISDRFSGNGTVFREPERSARRCDPGKRYRVARGTRVEIGEQFFIVS